MPSFSAAAEFVSPRLACSASKFLNTFSRSFLL
nr:MAG TPA: hypothetical protein [Caudoviricetes sp.]